MHGGPARLLLGFIALEDFRREVGFEEVSTTMIIFGGGAIEVAGEVDLGFELAAEGERL